MKILICAAFFFFIIFGLLSAQITIDWTEIPQDIGTQFSHNGVDSVVVDLLSSGGPHAWQFTSQPNGPQNTDAVVVPKASTPFGDSFPTSNLVYRIAEGSDTLYEYLGLASTYGCNLGQGIISSVTVFFRFDPVDTNPLPMVYGANRDYQKGYTIDLGSSMELRVDNWGHESVDGWGTVTVAYGTFDCLRVCQFDTVASTILFNGNPISGDTTNNIIYDFVVEDYGVAAHVLSNENETNPNYTFASFLGRLTDFSSGILESIEVAGGNLSVRIEPNPFTGGTSVELQGASLQHPVQIKVYDVSGRLVLSRSLVARTYQLGTDLKAGIYFVGIDGCAKQKIVKIN